MKRVKQAEKKKRRRVQTKNPIRKRRFASVKEKARKAYKERRQTDEYKNFLLVNFLKKARFFDHNLDLSDTEKRTASSLSDLNVLGDKKNSI
jgi:hypothetical protein